MHVDPTALVHDGLPAKVEVGPYTVIEEGAGIGWGATVGPFCHLHSCTTLGSHCQLGTGVVLGSPPQDLKYRGEPSSVEVGESVRLGDYVTVNRGTAASGKTVLGPRCFIMAYVHVAHDCDLGKDVIVANGVQMGGHVVIGDHSVISGMTGIHQFTVIGAGVFVGGGLRVARDVPPLSRALGEPLQWGGVNTRAFEKLGIPMSLEKPLKAFYRDYRRAPSLEKLSRVGDYLRHSVVEEIFASFCRLSKRGLLS